MHSLNKKKMLLLTLLSVCSYSAFAQEATLAQKQEGAQATKQPTQVDLTFVKEVSLAGNRDAKMTFFHSKQTEDPIPKIEVYERGIVFYDENGNMISQRGYDNEINVYPSANKRFLQVRRTTRPATKSENGEQVVDFIGDTGELLWSKRLVTEYEGNDSGFIVSNTGTVVEMQSMAGKLIFYGKTGNKLREVAVYKPTTSMVTAFHPHFSTDGKFFVVATSPAYTYNNRSEVILFTSEGQELWSFRTERKRGHKIYFSEDNKYIVTTHSNRGGEGRTTYVFDMNTGTLLSSYENMSANYVKFFQINSEDHILVIHDVRKKVDIMNVQGGEIIPIYSVETQLGIVDIDVANGNNLIGIIAEGGMPNTPAPYIAFFDLNGKELGRISLPTQHFIKYGSAHITFLNGSTRIMIELSREKK